MKKLLYIVLCLMAMVSCAEYNVSDDPSLRLSFSQDTLSFDTVFTEQGSATLQMKIYNSNPCALLIDRIWLEEGKAFRVNIDGEPQLDKLTRLQINGGDSLYVFVRVEIDPTNENNPVLVSDNLFFHLANNATQQVRLEAYGQDVVRVRPPVGETRTQMRSFTFRAEKPYLIYDTLLIGGMTRIEAGTTIYMHNGACIYALGDVIAEGSLDQPITIRGDRLDRLFDSVPYAYAGGSWNGIYLQANSVHNYSFSYVDILSGNVGLYCIGTNTSALPQLKMDGCRIHNHTQYGLALINTNAKVTNTEISNCASYCVYCAGGNHEFIHSTIASYFNYTSVRIQSVAKEDAAAVFIDNLSKTPPMTNTSFYNSIITGYLSNQLVVATPFDQYYPGVFLGNYLKTDTLRIPNANQNTYWQKTDTAKVFVNDFFKYKEYVYYDFRLDSLSPAIGIADSITALPYPTDRLNVSRALVRPDAGCYQHPW